MTLELRVGSVFSGIGGLDLGLERAGMRVVWQCESNKWCRRVLAKHWPGVPCYTDVRDITADAPSVDVLCGGFPCQPVSLAGRQRGQSDERWLWPQMARLVRVFRPRILIVENVTGLLNRGMGDVLGDLAACGYDAEWDCVPASAVGAPHRRDRVYVVAYPHGSGPQGRGRLIRSPRKLVVATRSAASGARTNGGESENHWEFEPSVGRLAYGVPHRVDRLRGLGNAVVPQVAEFLGRQVLHMMMANDATA